MVDGYELVRPFQQSDRVWLATKDGQRWTLKFAPVEARTSEAILHLFIKETWNATRLRGEYFVAALLPERTAHYYVMEFIEAPSLRSLLKARALAVDEAVALGRFLLDASQHLVRFELVHGDIKPENILVLTGYDQIGFKLIDLGSATEIFSITSRAGTASYLAPERFHQAPISERTEIFAIGVTLYEALTRAFPYGEIERFQTPVFHAAKAPTRLQPQSSAVVGIRHPARHRGRSRTPLPALLRGGASIWLIRSGSSRSSHESGNRELNPLRFYRTGFFLLLAATLYLLVKLLHH